MIGHESPHKRKAAIGGMAAPENCSLLSGENSPKNSPDHTAKQAIIALRCDFIAEALRIVALKASHAADDLEIGKLSFR